MGASFMDGKNTQGVNQSGDVRVDVGHLLSNDVQLLVHCSARYTVIPTLIPSKSRAEPSREPKFEEPAGTVRT